MKAFLHALDSKLMGLAVMVVLSLILAPTMGHAKDVRAVEVVPDSEKRSCIQEVDGFAYLSEDMTLAQTRDAAFLNAKRQAVEMAQTYIQSHSKVENFEIKSDTITGSAEGAVTVLEQKDHGIENNTRYHVWIKAEVEYSTGPSGGTASDMDPAAPLTVKVWTPQKQYKHGENIEIFIQGNRDFYARIVDITSNGQIIQLLPNAFRNLNFFKANKVYKIPDTGDHFDLKASPPYGQDQIVVYASEVPLGNVQLEPLGQGLGVFKGDRKSLGNRTRGISVQASDQKTSSGAQFYEAGWALTTGQ